MTPTTVLAIETWPGWTDDELKASKISKAKGFVFMVGVVCAYTAASTIFPLPEPLPTPSAPRMVAQCLLALGMVAEFGTEMFAMPPATTEREVFPLLQYVGKTIFLTFQIEVIQTVHMIAGAAAEIALFTHSPVPALSAFNYSVSIFVDTTGVVLTLLFLKFNWFEKEWQLQARGVWESRGVRMGMLSLVSHIPSLPIGLLDIIVKDHHFLRACSPIFVANALVIAAFASYYVAWIHVWWAASGYKCWPYPFLHKFDTCLKRILFAMAIIVAIIVVMAGISLLSFLLSLA